MHKIIITLTILFFISSCATYKHTSSSNSQEVVESSNNENIFLIGDTGYSENGSNLSPVFEGLKKTISETKGKNTVLFLGDNIYPEGIPSQDDEKKEKAKKTLLAQINSVKDIADKVIFVPGNHDWYSGIDGLNEQEKFVEKHLGKDSFFPKNACPLDSYKLSDNSIIIFIDSEWYITNWNKHPKINDKCDYIKTREKFWEEFRGLINKNQNRNVILAMHHPMLSNGAHGGEYGFNSLGLPLLNIPLNVLRRTTGASPADLQHPLYRELANRVFTILHDYPNTTVVSGHEHGLQYIEEEGVKQVISGSGSKKTPLKQNKKDFGYPDLGFARIIQSLDKQNTLLFYNQEGEILHSKDISTIKKEYKNYQLPAQKFKTATIYADSLKKKGTEKFLNRRYRKYYFKEINAPIANLDTLYGGLEIVRKGGGNQSISFRLKDKDGKQYAMRRMRKSATQFIQVKGFQENYSKNDLKGTFPERFLLDFYTTSHPFSSLMVPKLSSAANVYHTNPTMYYLPKQNALNPYNEFGDELVLIEERPEKSWKNLESFGKPDNIISTDDLFRKILKDEKFVLDQDWYIRTRLFDMYLGDWDRHEDQYRWAVYENENKTEYRPIPRDRDQVFPKFDGLFLKAATRSIPSLRLMQSYADDIHNVENFNQIIYRVDLPLIGEATKEQWVEQAIYLKNNITDEVIEKAIQDLPKEVQDETAKRIELNLKARRDHLVKWAEEYYSVLSKTTVVKGTHKDDWFIIDRLLDGSTKLVAYRNKKGQKADVFFEKIFKPEETSEIWVYGLDDDDIFEVIGEGKTKIKLILVGGQNNDDYRILNSRKLVVHDYKSKKNTFSEGKYKKKLTNDYHTNVYNQKKFKNNTNQVLPNFGYDPDNGFQFGLVDTYTQYGFNRNPFTQKHTISAKYYTSISGFDVGYKGEFSRVIGNLNLGIDGRYSSPNFSFNFFGLGNETQNLADDNGEVLDIDFYRIRVQEISGALSLIRRGRLGSKIQLRVPLESFEVENTDNRITQTLNSEQFETKTFTGADLGYHYKNLNSAGLPSLGINFGIVGGYRVEISGFDDRFFYLKPELSLYYPLLANGKLTASTKIGSHINFGTDFNLYQAASVGGNGGLRGFRNNRFTGQTSFYQNSNLNLELGRLRTGFLPLKIGLIGGFDYGRVWDVDDRSNIWHNSYGGGVWASGLDRLTLNATYFVSDDGGRLTIGLGLGL